MTNKQIHDRFISILDQLDRANASLKMFEYACQPYCDEIINREDNNELTGIEKIVFELPEALSCLHSLLDQGVREDCYSLMLEVDGTVKQN